MWKLRHACVGLSSVQRHSRHEARIGNCLLLILHNVAIWNRRYVAFQQLLSHCLSVLWTNCKIPVTKCVQWAYTTFLLLNNTVSDVADKIWLCWMRRIFSILLGQPPSQIFLPQLASVSYILSGPYTFCIQLAAALSIKFWCWRNATKIDNKQ